MKTPFPVSFATTLADFNQAVCELKSKEVTEIYEAFDVLRVWQDHLRPNYGELQSLVHFSNPDDPPDVLAQFSSGELSIEHTEIEPPHIKQSDVIHRDERDWAWKNSMPLSGQYTSAQQREIMWTPGHSGVWETHEANLKTRCRLIVSAIEKKMVKFPPGGMLILKGNVGCDQDPFGWELEMIKQAFNHVRQANEASKWVFVIHNRQPPFQLFSALSSPSKELLIQRESVEDFKTTSH